MLESLQLKNYRCFDNHTIPFRNNTVVVGRNNAGKSTIIEALRLLSIVTERYTYLRYQNVPVWLDAPRVEKGVSLDISKLNVSWENLFHRYSDPPASIVASFTSGHKIKIYMGPDNKMHCVIEGKDRKIVNSKALAAKTDLPAIGVLPQITPLEKQEDILNPIYVRSNMSSHLSSRHFRNQLNIFYHDFFEEFTDLVESTWPKLQIIELQGQGGLPNDPLSLIVRDGDFSAEIAWMGHGLQMWLQTMWFIARTRNHSSIILDEPDVYMHPDLQRKIARQINEGLRQSIIATHSIEIMSETHPEDILIVNRKRKKSNFTTSLPAVQKIIEQIGSAQNIQLARIWDSGKLIMVEGKDMKFLRNFHAKCFPESKKSLDSIPNMQIGGWSNWPYAVGSAMLLKNAMDEQITSFCFLDRDYYQDDVIDERIDEAKKKGVRLHVWSKKEIENYLIVPSLLKRKIARGNQTVDLSLEQIEEIINEFCEELKARTTDLMSQEIFKKNRSRGLPDANKRARELVSDKWLTLDGKISIVSGKSLLSMLSEWSGENFGVTFGALSLSSEIMATEISDEIKKVLSDIEKA